MSIKLIKKAIQNWNKASVDDILPLLKSYIIHGGKLPDIKIPTYPYPEDVEINKIICVDSYGYYLYGDEKNIKKLKSTLGGISRRVLKTMEELKNKKRGRRLVIPTFTPEEQELFDRAILSHMKKVGYRIAEGVFAKTLIMDSLKKKK